MAEHTALGVVFVEAAMTEGKGQFVGRGLEKEDSGNGQAFVDDADKQGVSTASVLPTSQLHNEKRKLL